MTLKSYEQWRQELMMNGHEHEFDDELDGL